MVAKVSKRVEKLNYWQSCSDMMSSLLLVFALVLSGTLLEMKNTYEKKETELIEKRKELAEKEKIIKSQQEHIDKIIGIRSELIRTLREKFADSEFSVSVDPQTGAIAFDSKLLFDFDSCSLRKEGVSFLESFLPKYIDILLNEAFSQYLAEIIIEGHTDKNGTYMYNLALSQNRALAVATYCLDEKNKLLSLPKIEKLRKLITSNGRSFSSPIKNTDGSDNYDASRRVELKFRLKDDEMMQQLADIFNNIDEK